MRGTGKTRPGNGRRVDYAPGRQSGVYAIEFAIVFPIFFLLFYGVLTFGLIFTAKQSLTLAAEDGARATLRYRLVTTSGSSVMMAQLNERLSLACQVAADRVSWLQNAGAAPTCEAVINGRCANADGTAGASMCSARFTGGVPSARVFCGYQATDQCQATLTVAYNYRANPLVPTMPGLGLVVPGNLQGVATVTLDPAVLQRMGTGA
ncbi:TadE/TadG family type IV pilus assembly protein [Pigmentiphaga litoralis]|uniref:TadE/TadG family type IV pilus assembly protein n=1 Tax=Pigmentiphaga litoralis TaxID=516702 RepID=UPI003B4297DA